MEVKTEALEMHKAHKEAIEHLEKSGITMDNGYTIILSIAKDFDGDGMTQSNTIGGSASELAIIINAMLRNICKQDMVFGTNILLNLLRLSKDTGHTIVDLEEILKNELL